MRGWPAVQSPPVLKMPMLGLTWKRLSSGSRTVLGTHCQHRCGSEVELLHYSNRQWIGALWVRDGVKLTPLIHGGGQEQGLRSGTLSPALCVGFGVAATLAAERMEADAQHVEALWQVALDQFRGWTINGSVEARYRGNLNIRRDGLDGARLMSELRSVAFSAGSACASGSGRPSHVLQALGLTERQAKSSVRLGWGRYSTEEDIIVAARLINEAAGEIL